MKINKFGIHIFFLCILMVLGNSILTLPFGNMNFLTFAIFSFVLSLLLFLLSCALIKIFQKYNLIFCCICFLYCLIAVWSATNTFLDFYKFLTSVQMPRANNVLVLVTLLCTVVIFSLFRLSAIYKYCLGTGILVVIIIAVCFLSGMKNYDFSDYKTILNGNVFSLKMFVKYFLPLVVLPLIYNWQEHVFLFKYASCGFFAGFVILFIIACQTIFTLGLSSNQFDYLNAIGVISTGSLFSRLDGLAFFVFFVSSLVKITILIKAIVLSLKNLTSKSPDFN